MRAVACGWLIVACSLTECALADVSLEQRACPCVEGWTCRDGVCVAGDSTLVDGGASDAGSSPEAAPVVATCKQTGRGPMLVNVGDRVCIDATEVSLEQYRAFVASGETPPNMPERCAANTDRASMLVADAGDMPAFYVDWCDAFAYCAWAGKKLCGALPGHEADAATDATETTDAAVDAGFAHGLTLDDAKNRDVNAWLWACGGEHASRYPYGNGFDASAGCTSPGTGAFASATTRRVGGGCEGPVRGVFDMVGNVVEWIDACEHGLCARVGASECRDSDLHAPDFQPVEFQIPNLTPNALGVRCCGVEPPAP